MTLQTVRIDPASLPDAKALLLPFPADALQALPVAELGSRDGDIR